MIYIYLLTFLFYLIYGYLYFTFPLFYATEEKGKVFGALK